MSLKRFECRKSFDGLSSYRHVSDFFQSQIVPDPRLRYNRIEWAHQYVIIPLHRVRPYGYWKYFLTVSQSSHRSTAKNTDKPRTSDRFRAWRKLVRWYIYREMKRTQKNENRTRNAEPGHVRPRVGTRHGGALPRTPYLGCLLWFDDFQLAEQF